MIKRRILLYGLVFGLTGPFLTLLFLIFSGYLLCLLNGELPGAVIFDYQLMLPMLFIAYLFGAIPAFITGGIASLLPKNKIGSVLVGVLLSTSPFLIIGVPLVHSDGTISILGWIAVSSACTSALLAWLMTHYCYKE